MIQKIPINYHHRKLELLLKKTFKPNQTSLTVESVRGVISGIKQHLGLLGIVPAHLIEKEMEQGTIRVIQTPARELINHISLVRLLDTIPQLTEKQFTAFFQGFVKELGDR